MLSYPPSDYTPVFSCIRVAQSLVYCMILMVQGLRVRLIILFWLCYCLLFVDLRLLINTFKMFVNRIASCTIAN